MVRIDSWIELIYCMVFIYGQDLWVELILKQDSMDRID